MSEVNNFLTDLLDAMMTDKEKSLYIEAGSSPFYLTDIPHKDIMCQEITNAELISDLEALGITHENECYAKYQYVSTANAGETANFHVYMAATEAKASVLFKRTDAISYNPHAEEFLHDPFFRLQSEPEEFSTCYNGK